MGKGRRLQIGSQNGDIIILNDKVIIKSDKSSTELQKGTGTTGITLSTDTAHFNAGTYLGFLYGTLYKQNGGSAKLEARIGTDISNYVDTVADSANSKTKIFTFVIPEEGDRNIILSLKNTYNGGTGIIPAYESYGYLFVRI